MKIVEWKAWFVGGETYTSTESAAGDLPADGCLGIVLIMDEKNPQGLSKRRVMGGSDQYFMWDGPAGTVYGKNNESDIAERYPGAKIIRGMWTCEEEFAQVTGEMQMWFGDG